MKISRECIHCLARQAVEIATESTSIEEEQDEIIKKSLKELSESDFKSTAPEIAFKMHQIAKDMTGIIDPYKSLKEQYNEIAEDISKIIKHEKWLEKSENRFDTACRLAIAGNIIDFSVGLDLDYSEILKSVKDSMHKNIFGNGSISLEEAVKKSERILYIADNAGEIIFDKFLIELLPKEKVTFAVKGGPIVNDATFEDAISTGITDIVNVIDNGHSAQGTILKDCSVDFKKDFEQADLIISKGQANFETLSHINGKNIFFLLRAKCKAVALEIGCNHMDYVLTNNAKV